MSALPASCGTKLPWFDHPFRLISWLEMNKFSAEEFLKIGNLMGIVVNASHQMAGKEAVITGNQIKEWLLAIRRACGMIGLTQSFHASFRVIEAMGGKIHASELAIRVEDLGRLIESEMREQLFFWMPSHYADFHSKDAVALVGEKCCKGFPSIAREVEEAAKCYAFGRFTACVFHLSRATEAGIKAVGIALGQKRDHEIIERTLKFIEGQTLLNPANQIKEWRTHGEFFATIAVDVRAIARAWRNKVCHLVDSYSEERAKAIFDVSPMFFKHVAEHIDETGKLH